MRAAILVSGTIAGASLLLLDEPWLTNEWDWTLPGSLALTLATGVLLGPPWAYLSPLLVIGAQHLVYETALRTVSDPRLTDTANLGLYVLAEIVLLLALALSAWTGTAIRMVIDARRGRV